MEFSIGLPNRLALLLLGLHLVEHADEHEVGDLLDDINWICDSTGKKWSQRASILERMSCAVIKVFGCLLDKK